MAKRTAPPTDPLTILLTRERKKLAYLENEIRKIEERTALTRRPLDKRVAITKELIAALEARQ